MFTMQQAERTALVITYCNQMIIVKHLLLVVTSVVITSCQSKANAGWMEKGATTVQLVLSVVATIWLHAWVSYALLLSFLLASLLQQIRVFGGVSSWTISSCAKVQKYIRVTFHQAAVIPVTHVSECDHSLMEGHWHRALFLVARRIAFHWFEKLQVR